jgi:hypothetical protein
MANLTITVDPETLKRARIKALEQGTSVNALLREYLESYAGDRQEQIEALERIFALAKEVGAGSGPEGRTWKREDLYDGPFGRAR